MLFMTDNKILVIDNDQATTNWLANFLSDNGYAVTTAITGSEGLRAIEAEGPNLVILDMDLPDISGERVIESITHNPITAHIPVIVLTGEYNQQAITGLFEKGISDFVIKKPGVETELLGKCAVSLSRTRRPFDIAPTGRLISFFSPKGGTGTSTLCLNLAHLLAQQVETKTVLVADLVLPLGSLATMAGLHQGSSIARLTTEEGSYDSVDLKEFLVPSEDWNFYILQGSQSPHESQALNPTRIEPLFETLLTSFDYVIVDVGKTLSRISLPILKRSNVVVIVLGIGRWGAWVLLS
jgi:pilus assembly protein CpaE